jgi:hypothetical protein
VARATSSKDCARDLRSVVFTTRYPDNVRRWLPQSELHNLADAVTDRKPAAHIFVHDRTVCFRGDCAATLCEIDDFAAHWESPI